MEEKVFRLITTHILLNGFVLKNKDIFAAAMTTEGYPEEIVQRYRGAETDKYVEMMKNIGPNRIFEASAPEIITALLALHAVSGKDEYINLLDRTLKNLAISSNNLAEVIALSLTSVTVNVYTQYYDEIFEILEAPWSIKINDEPINDPEVNPLAKAIILERLEKTNTPEYKKHLDEAKKLFISFDEAYMYYKNMLEEFLAAPKKFVVNTYLYDDPYETFVKGLTIDEFAAFFTNKPPVILSNLGLMTRIYELPLDEFKYLYSKDYRIRSVVSAEQLYLALSDPASLIFS